MCQWFPTFRRHALETPGTTNRAIQRHISEYLDSHQCAQLTRRLFRHGCHVVQYSHQGRCFHAQIQNNEQVQIWKQILMACLKTLSEIRLEFMRKTTTNFTQNGWQSGRDTDPEMSYICLSALLALCRYFWTSNGQLKGLCAVRTKSDYVHSLQATAGS